MPTPTTRNVRVFRYDPAGGDEGHFDSFVLDIPDETTATMLDVLLRIQREQDPTIAFRFACRVDMCGSCGMVINGQRGPGLQDQRLGHPARKGDHPPATESLSRHQGPGGGHGAAVPANSSRPCPSTSRRTIRRSRPSSGPTRRSGRKSAWPPSASPAAAASQAAPCAIIMRTMPARRRWTAPSPFWPTAATACSSRGSSGLWPPAMTAGRSSTAPRFAPKKSAPPGPSSTSSAWR